MWDLYKNSFYNNDYSKNNFSSKDFNKWIFKSNEYNRWATESFSAKGWDQETWLPKNWTFAKQFFTDNDWSSNPADFYDNINKLIPKFDSNLGFPEAFNNLDMVDKTNNANLDIVYGDKPWQKLDVFAPQSSDATTPVLVFFYGGGWHDGSKEKYRYVAKTFTDLGYLVVIPDYVKYPQGKFPDFIYDGAKALRWVKDNCESFGGDSAQINVAGHSAGAHLGALLVTDPHYLETVNMEKSDINAFIGLAGPYDFTPLIKRYNQVFDDPDLYPNIRVSNFVDGKEPPMLLLEAGADMIVGSYTCQPLLDALERSDTVVEHHSYQGMGHLGIVMALAPTSNIGTTVTADMHSFFQRQSL